MPNPKETSIAQRLQNRADHLDGTNDIMLEAVEHIKQLEKERARVLAIVAYHTSEEPFAEPSEKVLNQLFKILNNGVLK